MRRAADKYGSDNLHLVVAKGYLNLERRLPADGLQSGGRLLESTAASDAFLAAFPSCDVACRLVGRNINMNCPSAKVALRPASSQFGTRKDRQLCAAIAVVGNHRRHEMKADIEMEGAVC